MSSHTLSSGPASPQAESSSPAEAQTAASSPSASSSTASSARSASSPGPWSALTPTASEVEALRDRVGPGPVVMINLLKFREPNGREAMARYGQVSAPLVMRSQGEVVYAGEAGPLVAGREGEDWDTVILVRFPDIEAFIALAADPVYQTEARPLREEALKRTLWMVTRPAGGA